MFDRPNSISNCLKNVIEYNAVKVGRIHGERFYQDVYGKALLEKVEPYYVSKLLLGISERHSKNKIQKNTGETTILSDAKKSDCTFKFSIEFQLQETKLK